MAMAKSIPDGVQAVFPMLVCPSPEAEMNFCASAFGAVEQVRRPGPDGSPIHIAMRINEAFLVVQPIGPCVDRRITNRRDHRRAASETLVGHTRRTSRSLNLRDSMSPGGSMDASGHTAWHGDGADGVDAIGESAAHSRTPLKNKRRGLLLVGWTRRRA
jgi:hypothetical protein